MPGVGVEEEEGTIGGAQTASADGNGTAPEPEPQPEPVPEGTPESEPTEYVVYQAKKVDGEEAFAVAEDLAYVATVTADTKTEARWQAVETDTKLKRTVDGGGAVYLLALPLSRARVVKTQEEVKRVRR